MNMEQTLKVSYAISHIKSLLAKSQEFQNAVYSVNKAGLDIDVFKNVFSPAYSMILNISPITYPMSRP